MNKMSRKRLVMCAIITITAVLSLYVVSIGYASIVSSVTTSGNSVTSDSMSLDIVEDNGAGWNPLTDSMIGTVTKEGDVYTYSLTDYALAVNRPSGDTHDVIAWVILDDPLAWFVITDIMLTVYDSESASGGYQTYNLGLGADDQVNLYSDPIRKSTAASSALPDGTYRFKLEIQYENTYGLSDDVFADLVSGICDSKLVFIVDGTDI